MATEAPATDTTATNATDTALAPSAAPATVEQLMRPPVTTVEPTAHLAAAAYLMKRSGDSALVVTTDGDGRRPIAVLTDADISQAVADGRDPGETRISDLGIGQPVTVAVGTSPLDAARLMLLRSVHHLPVVDGDRLVGIVDMADVCRVLVGPEQAG